MHPGVQTEGVASGSSDLPGKRFDKESSLIPSGVSEATIAYEEEVMMKPRERVLRALNIQEPDRVPADLGGMNTGIEADAYEDLKRHLGISGPTMVSARAHAVPAEEVLQRFNIDTRYVYPYRLKQWNSEAISNSSTDEWGVKWARPESSYYFDIVHSPLSDASLADLERYAFPTRDDYDWQPDLEEKARFLYEETDYAVVANALDVGLFERTWFIRGFEQFMVDLVLDQEFAGALLEKVLESKLDALDYYLGKVGKYIHVIMLGDDLAMQDGPLFSLDLYRRLIKPRQKEINDLVRSKTDAKIFFHCCGSAYPFIEDFLEIGVDILNPVQVSAANMDTANLKRQFGSQIVFWGGGCDTQHVLQFGSPADVDREVKQRINDLAPGGGFVFNQVHCIQPDVPPENICAMYDAMKKYGVYPRG